MKNIKYPDKNGNNWDVQYGYKEGYRDYVILEQEECFNGRTIP